MFNYIKIFLPFPKKDMLYNESLYNDVQNFFKKWEQFDLINKRILLLLKTNLIYSENKYVDDKQIYLEQLNPLLYRLGELKDRIYNSGDFGKLLRNILNDIKKDIRSLEYSYKSLKDYNEKHNNIYNYPTDIEILNIFNKMILSKSILVEEDYFNIKQIHYLREKIKRIAINNNIKNYIQDYSKLYNPIVILFSDYKLLDYVIKLLFSSKFVKIKYRLDQDDLDYLLIYSLYLINITNLLLSNYDRINKYDRDIYIYIYILYCYITNIFLKSNYIFFNKEELLYIVISNYLNIAPLSLQELCQNDFFLSIQSLLSKFARTRKKDEVYDILCEICLAAKKKWIENNSTLDHIDMALSFMKIKKYNKFFNDPKFEKKIIIMLKNICKEYNIRRIRGIDTFKRNTKSYKMNKT